MGNHTIDRGTKKTPARVRASAWSGVRGGLLSTALVVASLGTVAAGSAQRAQAAATTGPTFTPNLKLASASIGGVLATFPAEPSIRVSQQGDIYVAAPNGVPTGCDFWTVSPTATSSVFKGLDDNSAGGGDCDIATSYMPQVSAPGTGKDVVAASSLTAANITTTASFDRGTTWTPSNPVGQQIPAVDREWNQAGSRTNPLEFYMYYKSAGLANAYVAHSIDGGITYAQTGPAVDIDPGNPTAHFTAHISNIAVDSTGTKLYVLFNQNSAETTVWLAESTDSGMTWSWNAIHSGSTSFGHIFPSLALDPSDQTLYAVYSDENNIHFASSSVANALTSAWADFVVPVLDSTKINIMPWVYSNKTGQADLVWYGTPDATEATTSTWNVYFARWTGGPNFAVSKVSDHVIHKGFICETGAACSGTVGTSGDRTLLDFFQVADDSNGVAHVAWADDHTTAGTPNIYYAREIGQQPCVGCIPEAPWVPALLLVPGAAALLGVGLLRRRRRGEPLQPS